MHFNILFFYQTCRLSVWRQCRFYLQFYEQKSRQPTNKGNDFKRSEKLVDLADINVKPKVWQSGSLFLLYSAHKEDDSGQIINAELATISNLCGARRGLIPQWKPANDLQ